MLKNKASPKNGVINIINYCTHDKISRVVDRYKGELLIWMGQLHVLLNLGLPIQANLSLCFSVNQTRSLEGRKYPVITW